MEQTNLLPNPPVPPAMPTPPPVSSSSSNKSALAILVVVLLVVLSSLITYLLVKSQTPSQTPISSPSTTQPSSIQPSTIIPSPTTDATANWKTYTFQPIQLSLKVPPELAVHTEEPNPGNDFTAYIQNYPYNLPSPEENAYQLYIIWQKTPTVTQTEFQQLKDNLDINSIEDITVAGYPTIKGQVKGERNRFVVYILKENTEISLFTSEPTEVNRKLTDQILSTFKFLE